MLVTRSRSALVVLLLAAPVAAQTDLINFEDLPVGSIPTSIDSAFGTGPIGVMATNPALGPGVNAAVVFDAANPPAADLDLGAPNEDFGGPGVGAGGGAGSPFANTFPLSHVLVVGDDLTDADGDGLVDTPGDAEIDGTRITFDFTALGTVTVLSAGILDFEDVARVEIHTPEGDLIAFLALPSVGDNGFIQAQLGGFSGVGFLTIGLNGPGAVDVVHFTVDEPPAGGEGCTPGYWKQPQHFDSWPAPFTPDTPFADVFDDAFAGMTLLDVLGQGGGGLQALGRHTVAALLNAASDGVDYDLSPDDVVDMFDLVYPGTKADYEGLKHVFEAFNQQGCPLD